MPNCACECIIITCVLWLMYIFMCIWYGYSIFVKAYTCGLSKTRKVQKVLQPMSSGKRTSVVGTFMHMAPSPN